MNEREVGTGAEREDMLHQGDSFDVATEVQSEAASFDREHMYNPWWASVVLAEHIAGPASVKDLGIVPTFSTDEILVLDDFLTIAEMAALWRSMQTSDLTPVHGKSWNKAWRLNDGVPLRGEVVVSSKNTFDNESACYPTGQAIDVLISKLRKLASTFSRQIGREAVDWTHFFVRAYAYSAGSGLSWHRDNQARVAGAFTYYCHPRWGSHWGGELLVADPATKNASIGGVAGNQTQRAFFEPAEMDDALATVGVGHYVFPKPNRLVLLCPGVLHSIKKVDGAAGENVRGSYQGFFFKAP